MSITLNLRYQKKDRYGSEIFIVSNKYDEEVDGFDKLKTLVSKIEELKLNTFNPVYFNEDLNYCTMRFKFYRGIRLYERNIYQVTFVIKQSERDNRQFVNCYINGIKIIKKAKPVDSGLTLTLM